jgi:hypothetical protein
VGKGRGREKVGGMNGEPLKEKSKIGWEGGLKGERQDIRKASARGEGGEWRAVGFPSLLPPGLK